MAIEVSVQQMALTRDVGPGGFMERVQAMLAMVTPSILGEPAATAFHQPRAYYAQKVVGNPRQMAELAGPQVVMGTNVKAFTTYDEATKTATCTIPDLDLQSQIQFQWNALAGIDTAV